jgi:hypothetical protein
VPQYRFQVHNGFTVQAAPMLYILTNALDIFPVEISRNCIITFWAASVGRIRGAKVPDIRSPNMRRIGNDGV